MILKALRKPFNNRKGNGFAGLLFKLAYSILAIVIVCWIIFRSSDSIARARFGNYLNNMTDAIAENGGFTSSMQTTLYENIRGLKGYAGDIEVKFYTYDIISPGSKTLMGTSKNGASVGAFTVSEGKMIYVTLVTSETPLDRLTKVFYPSSVSLGIRDSSGKRVD